MYLGFFKILNFYNFLLNFYGNFIALFLVLCNRTFFRTIVVYCTAPTHHDAKISKIFPKKHQNFPQFSPQIHWCPTTQGTIYYCTESFSNIAQQIIVPITIAMHKIIKRLLLVLWRLRHGPRNEVHESRIELRSILASRIAYIERSYR